MPLAVSSKWLSLLPASLDLFKAKGGAESGSELRIVEIEFLQTLRR